MSSFTEERAAKVRDNLSIPEIRTVEQFAVDLRTIGVDPGIISTRQLRSALDLRGKAIEFMSLASKPLVEQDSNLTFIIDALVTNGENLLTEDGLVLIGDAQNVEVIYSGLEAFEGIVGIVDTQKLRGHGELIAFNEDNPRDVQMANTFQECIDQWVRSGMGDPKLADLPLDELLIACANFPDADRKAFDLLYPDQVGKVTGESLGFSIATEFEKISLRRINHDDGTKAVLKGIDPGSIRQVPTGPLDR